MNAVPQFGKSSAGAPSYASCTTSRQSGRRGFVLLSVVLVLAIAIVFSGAIAGRSLSLSLEASRRVDACQKRWLRVSATQYLLPAILSTPHSTPSETVTATFGSSVVMLQLASEQAKLNPRRLRAQLGRARSDSLLRTVVGRTLPHDALADTYGFESWATLLQSPSIDWPELEKVSQNTTFWGDGRLHLTASDERTRTALLSEALGPHQASEVTAVLADSPVPTVAALAAKLDWRESDVAKLQRSLTDETQAVSLWLTVDNAKEFHILARSPNGRFYTDSVIP